MKDVWKAVGIAGLLVGLVLAVGFVPREFGNGIPVTVTSDALEHDIATKLTVTSTPQSLGTLLAASPAACAVPSDAVRASFYNYSDTLSVYYAVGTGTVTTGGFYITPGSALPCAGDKVQLDKVYLRTDSTSVSVGCVISNYNNRGD